MKVFVSYSLVDQGLVECELARIQSGSLTGAELDDHGAWITNIGDPRSEIKRRIGEADEVLLVWSDSAAGSPYVNYEIGIAQAFGKRIRVFFTADCKSEPPLEAHEDDILNDGPARTLTIKNRSQPN